MFYEILRNLLSQFSLTRPFTTCPAQSIFKDVIDFENRCIDLSILNRRASQLVPRAGKPGCKCS